MNRELGLPISPGWESPAYVSRLASALRHDSDIGAGLLELDAYIEKIRCKIRRTCSIKEVAIQTQLYNILIGKIPNGWNPLVSKRLIAYGVYTKNSATPVYGLVPWTAYIESDLIYDLLEFFKLKLKKIQPRLKMSFVKTITNG